MFTTMDENQVEDFLLAQGYSLTQDREWIMPHRHNPTEDELEAVLYLHEEFDYSPFIEMTREDMERIINGRH